jgi:biopolymer transport protein ExbB/TolQ
MIPKIQFISISLSIGSFAVGNPPRRYKRLSMLANLLIDYILKGGPIMYPILLVGLVVVAVIGERSFWWLRLSAKREPRQLENVLAAMENGETYS